MVNSMPTIKLARLAAGLVHMKVRISYNDDITLWRFLTVKYWQIPLKTAKLPKKIPRQNSSDTVCPTQVEQCNVSTYSIFTNVCVLLLLVRHIHMHSFALRTWSTLLIQKWLVAMVTSSFGKFTNSMPLWGPVPACLAAGQCLHELQQSRLWLLCMYLIA